MTNFIESVAKRNLVQWAVKPWLMIMTLIMIHITIKPMTHRPTVMGCVTLELTTAEFLVKKHCTDGWIECVIIGTDSIVHHSGFFYNFPYFFQWIRNKWLHWVKVFSNNNREWKCAENYAICTTKLFQKAALDMQVRSNHNSFRVLFDKTAANNYSLQIIQYFCLGNGQFYKVGLQID